MFKNFNKKAVVVNMNRSVRVFISIYIVSLVVIGTNLVFGELGLLAFQEMSNYKETLENNIYELKRINNSLLQESEKLISQPETITLQARNLGWLKPDENIIVVKGLKPVKNDYVMGSLLSNEKHSGIFNSRNFTIFSLIAGFIFFILSGFYKQEKIKKNL